MTISAAQRGAIEAIINTILSVTGRRGKRRVADMFVELVDRELWADYYDIIPHPRCISGVRAQLAQNKYKNALEAYEDLALVFLNALYYNEAGSQITKDAMSLKTILDREWEQSSSLPDPPPGLPEKSAQTAYGVTLEPPKEDKPRPITPIPDSPDKMDVDPPAPATSPEADIDIGGTPEPERERERDADGDEIVRQLERTLPKWEGFDDVGWADGLDEDRRLQIVLAVKEYRDPTGVRPAASLEAMPEETNIQDFPFDFPLSLALVERRARERYYASSQAFDKEMSQLFLKGRRWHPTGSDAYGHVLLLQRFYHALTSRTPPAPPYSSTTRFASVSVGPGTARAAPASTAHTPVEQHVYKGWTVRVGDWVHLSNPDDARRPIVGQVFATYISDEPGKKGEPGLNVCWYHRPEQTYHPAHRKFWDKEIFKSSSFADHALADVLEKAAVQSASRAARGRPRAPLWHPGRPLYVCESRYQARERAFARIRHWAAAGPPGAPNAEDVHAFARPVPPRKVPSPFVGGGAPLPLQQAQSFEAPVKEEKEGVKVEVAAVAPAPAPAPPAKKKKRSAPAPAAATPAAAPPPAIYVQPAAPPPQRAAVDRSIVAAAGGAAALAGGAATAVLPPETVKWFDRDPESGEVLWFAGPPADVVRAPGPQHSLAYLAHLARKRKQAEDGAATRKRAAPTVTETIGALLKEYELEDV